MILLELLRNIDPINIRFFSSIKGLNKNILVNVRGEILESHISYNSIASNQITSKLPNNFIDYFLNVRLRNGFVMIDKDWEYVAYTESFCEEQYYIFSFKELWEQDASFMILSYPFLRKEIYYDLS